MPARQSNEELLKQAMKSLRARPITRRQFLYGAVGLSAGLGAAFVRSEQLVQNARSATSARSIARLPFEIAHTESGTSQPPVDKGSLVAWSGSIGWGYRVAADKSYQQMVDEMRLLQSWGSNTVWLTHANPGWDVAPYGEEANFSVKDYVAMTNRTHERDKALQQLDSLQNALTAAGNVGLKVILSTGYQTSPGRWWAEQYPRDLRRARDGSNPIRPGWGRPDHHFATIYSPRFQDLYRNFAGFLKENVIDQHPGTAVLAIVNSDEPTATDYSAHADVAFRSLYGMSMTQALRVDPYRVGEFQAKSWGHLAAWFAALWQQVDPRLWNLNTFHFERTAPWFPSIGAIFEMAQGNMAVSYDSHPQDTDPRDPFSRDHLLLLNIMARTVAYHAFAYGRRNQHYATTPLMLWAGGNRWSLNYAHDEAEGGHATVQDAVDSLHQVVKETKRVGGDISALLAWHFDIPHQRLPEAMQQEAFAAVSKSLRELQPSLSQVAQPESPSIVLSYNEERMLTEVGKRGIFDLYDRVLLPNLLKRRGLKLEVLAAENSVVLPINSRAYELAMQARPDVREIRLF